MYLSDSLTTDADRRPSDETYGNYISVISAWVRVVRGCAGGEAVLVGRNWACRGVVQRCVLPQRLFSYNYGHQQKLVRCEKHYSTEHSLQEIKERTENWKLERKQLPRASPYFSVLFR